MATTAYTPGAGQYSTYAAQVKLAPGESLHFQTGKGYYAGPGAPKGTPLGGNVQAIPHDMRPPVFKPTVPTGGGKKMTPKAAAPPAPTPPVDPYAALSPSAIDTEATTMAQGELTPQQAEIQRQAALAKAQALADEQAITGFRTAAGTILAGIAPEVSAGYTAAEQEQGQLGQGMATGVKDDLAAAAAKDQSFAESQGQSGGTSVDPNAVHDSIYALNGQIPGESLGAQGAAATALAAEQPAINLAAGREELDARLAQAHKDNDGYAQQLIQLAATFPDLKAKALAQLNQYELDKANYKRQLFDSQTQRRAEVANEKLAGIKTTQAATNAANLQAYRVASIGLRFKSQQDAAAARAAKGKTIDVSASKLLGHIVYKDGTENSGIKVAQSGSTGAVATQRAISHSNSTAFKEATTLYGKPVSNKNVGTLTGGKGKYIAATGARGKGVYAPAYKGAPATTDSLALAARTGQGAANYADALQKVLASIAGSGLSQAQMVRIAKRMLKAAGWKPGR